MKFTSSGKLAVLCALTLFAAVFTACDQIGIGAESLGSADIAMFRANAQRTGVYETAGLEKYQSTKWQFEADDWIFGAPAVIGDTVIAVSYDGNVFALDRETGTEKWRFKTGDSILASPAVAGDLVYVASLDKIIYALDLATGEKKWQVQGEGVYTGSPAVDGGTLFVNSDSGLLLALDATTGKEKWRHNTDGDPTPYSVAVSDDVVYTIAGSGVLYALNAADGSELWQFDSAKELVDNIYSPTATPVVDGDTIYLTLTDINSATIIQALVLSTQKIKWHSETPGESYSAPAVAGNVLVHGGMDFKIHGLNKVTGESIWEVPTGGIIFSAAAVTGNIAYMGSTDMTLYALDTRTGEVLWRFMARGGVSSPAVSDGVVYVGDDSGILFAIQ